MKNRKRLTKEFEGVSVEKAIQKALKELKITRDKIQIQVLSEEEKGLFGMSGAKPAKIRVSIKE